MHTTAWYVKVAGKKPLLKNKHIKVHLDVAKKHQSDVAKLWNKVRQKQSFLKIQNAMCREKLTLSIHIQIPNTEEWGWQNHAAGMIFLSRDWVSCSNLRENG